MNDISRRGFLALTGVAGVAGLAACAGTGSSTGTGASGGGQGGASGTVEWWSSHPGNSKDIETKIAQGFQSANSGLTVKLVDGGKNYEEVQQKFNAALAGGQLPDVIVVSDVTWFNLAINKQLAPLDDLLGKVDAKTDDFITALYNDYKFKDQHYAVPFARSTPLFYYNKDMWAKAGLEDRGPKDWDEFKSWVPKLAAVVGSGNVPMLSSDGSNYLDWVFQNLAWDMGGGYSKDWTPTFTASGTIAAGQYLQDLAKAGMIKFGKSPDQDFAAGLGACAMMSTGSLAGVAKNAKFKVGTAFLPGTDNCPTGGAGLAIPAGISDERKANAAKFIAFVTNSDNTVAFSQATGYLPVRKSAIDSAAEKTYLAANPNNQTAVNQLPHTRSQDNMRVFVPGGGAKIGKALDQIAQGQNVTTVFTALQADLQQVFDSQLKAKVG